MAVTTSGFQLGALPQAPRINAADFGGAPQAFQKSLSDTIRIRAQQLELADAQLKSEQEQVLAPQRTQIEQATMAAKLPNIPVLAQADRVQAQATIATAPVQAQAAVAKARADVITDENRLQFISENKDKINGAKLAALELELEKAKWDGDEVTFTTDSTGRYKWVWKTSSKTGERKLLETIQEKTPEDIAQGAVKDKGEQRLLDSQIKATDALAVQREAPRARAKPRPRFNKDALGEVVNVEDSRWDAAQGQWVPLVISYEDYLSKYGPDSVGDADVVQAGAAPVLDTPGKAGAGYLIPDEKDKADLRASPNDPTVRAFYEQVFGPGSAARDLAQ